MKTQLQRALMGAATGVSLALAATAANATRPPLDPAPSPILVQGYYAVDVGNSGFVGLLTDTSGATGFGLTPGGSNANVAIGASLAGNPAAYASGAEIAGEHGQLLGSATITYLVDLHANSQAAADQIVARLNDFGAIAKVSGSYTNSVDGQAYALGNITTGAVLDDLNIDPSLSDGRVFSCDPGNIFPGGTNGCGSGTFSEVALNFVTSTNFVGGSAFDFYGVIQISAGGGVGPGGGFAQTFGGGFSAFMDPTITLGAGLSAADYSIILGGGQVGGDGGGVPEPATWALMIAGFGLAGASLRRRKPSAA